MFDWRHVGMTNKNTPLCFHLYGWPTVYDSIDTDHFKNLCDTCDPF